MMAEQSKLVKMRIVNIGCIGPEGLDVKLDNILSLVGSNNTGKSTVLRAYELAVGGEQFLEKDRSTRAGDAPFSVEIWVHIPKGTPNIAEEWKEKVGNLLLVRSKWEWEKDNFRASIRTTWNPEKNEYDADAKASGLDNVFTSRLPKPFRIGALEDPEKEHQKLLELILQPIADKIGMQLADEKSELKKLLSSISDVAQKPVKEESKKIEQVKIEINDSHNKIFPNLSIDFDIGLGEVDIKPIDLLKKNSKIKFLDWKDEVNWNQQGTGSQRALFWSMLQVRSKLEALINLSNQTFKEINDCGRKIKKLVKEAEDAARETTKAQKHTQIVELEKRIEVLKKIDYEEMIGTEREGLYLPGYMLLIDEPEVALHPSAIRSASSYLYELAQDPSWQVILSTHSPLFVDPLQDHTTIIRLDRSETNPTPKIYQADEISFSTREKENLKMLNRFDQDISQMFFGQYPILIEGDTEFAAFESIMNMLPTKYPIVRRPILVRSRGKYNLCLIIRMLTHFKINFSILHDCDIPKRKDGNVNSAWSANGIIHDDIVKARKNVKVIHRVSIVNFETQHNSIKLDKDDESLMTDGKEKPWNMTSLLLSDKKVQESVMSMLDDLMNNKGDYEPFKGNFNDELHKAVLEWAKKNAPKDSRFIITKEK